MKHSLCFNSIESKTQPSESMPTRKSCCGAIENMCRILLAAAKLVESVATLKRVPLLAAEEGQ
jgi:hypothetical protein